MKMKTNVKAGKLAANHNQRVINQRVVSGLRIKTGIKAGPPPGSTGSGGSGTGQ